MLLMVCTILGNASQGRGRGFPKIEKGTKTSPNAPIDKSKNVPKKKTKSRKDWVKENYKIIVGIALVAFLFRKMWESHNNQIKELKNKYEIEMQKLQKDIQQLKKQTHSSCKEMKSPSEERKEFFEKHKNISGLNDNYLKQTKVGTFLESYSGKIVVKTLTGREINFSIDNNNNNNNKLLIDAVKEGILKQEKDLPIGTVKIWKIENGTLYGCLVLRVGAPVIYLYAEESCRVEVCLADGKYPTISSPPYKDGWKVRVLPDICQKNGTNLENLTENGSKHLPYLYYELDILPDHMQKVDLRQSFSINGKGISDFFEENLPKLGLNPRECADFKLYWLHEFETNKHYFMHFAIDDEADQLYKLKIAPKPNSIRRIEMIYAEISSKEQYTFPKQTFPNPFERKGLSVVEWGGMKVPSSFFPKD